MDDNSYKVGDNILMLPYFREIGTVKEIKFLQNHSLPRHLVLLGIYGVKGVRELFAFREVFI